MSARRNKAFNRLLFAAMGGVIFGALFASQRSGGSNTGGVFPAPLLILGLLGMPVTAIVFIISAIQVFAYRNDAPDDERRK